MSTTPIAVYTDTRLHARLLFNARHYGPAHHALFLCIHSPFASRLTRGQNLKLTGGVTC